MNQYPVELHCHTNHSDGEFEVDELIESALDFGYKGLILTDHNTLSGYEEIIEKKLDQQIVFLKGVEWTTYFGHMLVHGTKEFVDWRTANIDTIDQHIEKVKQVEGLVGVAHPYAIGSPICTGCHWEYEVKNWSQVDYIEIWNRTNPHKQFWSEMAYELWISKLKQGVEISCSAGRDWHRPDPEGMVPGVTYIQTSRTFTPETMKVALKKGAMYITLAPRLEMKLTKDGQIYSFGDRIQAGQYELDLKCLSSDIPLLKELDIEPKFIRIIQNENLVKEIAYHQEASSQMIINLEKGYIRIEVLGRYQNEENTRLLIGNPVYVKEG